MTSKSIENLSTARKASVSNGVKTTISVITLAFVLAFPQVSSAMSYAFPYTQQQAQPIYYEQLSLTGCPYPTSVSAFTGTSASTGVSVPTGVSYDTSDSYLVGVSERTSESYLVGTSYRTGYSTPTGVSDGPVGSSYTTGVSYPTGVSAGPVGVSYSTGSSYATGYSTATGSSVPTGYSAPTNRPKGTKMGAPNYAQYSNPNYYHETPTQMQDSTGYTYVSYYPENAQQYQQVGAAGSVGSTAQYRYDEVMQVYYPSF